MKRTLKYKIGALLGGVVCTVSTMALAAPVNHDTVLTGQVVSVVSVGTTVKEGDVLVTVQTLGGPMVASRATVSGVVTSVAVEAGAHVDRGQVVTVVDGR